MDIVLYKKGNTRVGRICLFPGTNSAYHSKGGHAADCMESVTDGHGVSDTVALKLQWKLIQNADVGSCAQESVGCLQRNGHASALDSAEV